MVRLSQLALALVFAALLLPCPAVAHGGADPIVLVPVDHVLPGRSFPVIGADMEPNSVVSFKLMLGKRAVPLGRVTAGPDGHFRTTRVVPSNLPNGYAQLVASGPDDSQASAWVLVGEREEAAAPSSDGPSAAFIALVLVGAVAGVAATTLFALYRRARR